MAYPNVASVFALLGHRAKDKITGTEGIVTSVCFDLFGCVQGTLNAGVDKDKKPIESYWYDVSRIEVLSKTPVMTAPDFGLVPAANYTQGAADKPAPLR